MTKQDLITLITNEVTSYGSIPIKLQDSDFDKMIDVEMEMLYREYRELLQVQYAILNARWFHTKEFLENRTIQFPDCVVGIEKFHEINNGGHIGYGIGLVGGVGTELSMGRIMATDLYLSPWSGDSVLYNTMRWSTWDLMKTFMLQYIQFDWNPNTHRVIIKGRTPTRDIFVSAITTIPLESAYEDAWVRKWLIAKAKIHIGRSVSAFSASLVGGATINSSIWLEEGKSELEECKQYFKEINVPDYFMMIT